MRGSNVSVAEIERVYRERFGAFLRVAYGITRDRETAIDVVQETFATALRSRRSYRGDGPLEGWLWRSLVHNALKSKRRPPLAVVPDEVPASPSPEPGWLADPIRHLPERQRLVVFLRYYADLDYQTIARLLGIKVGTVSATLSAAHSDIRSAVEGAR